MISVLIPTRNRPFFMKSVVESGLATAKGQIQFIFYIDNDDTESIKTAIELVQKYMNQVKYLVGERIVLSQMWNECYKVATGEICMHCGDDIMFRTEGWDEIVLNKFAEIPDRIAFIYGDDGLPNGKTLATHGFLHRNWIQTLGYFVPPYFASDFNDTWLREVAGRIGRYFFVDIYTEHLHPGIEKFHLDQTHKDRVERHKRENVNELYESLADKRTEDAEKLQNFINSFQ